ncbi:MAG: recombinase family protein [Actinomycetota bacterium]|nr:recombinase family protein [Actinomycetota bacterium]
MEPIPDAELTAIYARKSMKGDKQEITVNRQKRLALDDCEKLGLIVDPKNIFIDNGASAWKRNRKRPGWDALIAAARRGEIKHIMCYHEDRALRQPWDLEELFSVSDEYGIMLYGRANARDLQNHNDRYNLRIEIAHACRSSDDTSRRLMDQKLERAQSGLPMGARAYGYTKNGMKIIPKEAEIIREIFDRFTKGEKPYAISVDLNKRGIPTARGNAWSEAAIRRQLKNTRVAGIAVHRGKIIGKGKWPAIISRPQWDFAQEMLTFRSSAAQEQRETRKRRTYILRGVVICGKCGSTMAGCSGKLYRCSRAIRQDDKKCARTMLAEPLEKFVEDAAIDLLEKLAVNPERPRTAAIAAAEKEISEDEQMLKDLHDMWAVKEIPTEQYRKDRREIQARINANEKKMSTRTKPVEAIADLIGADAKARWKKLTDERKNSVFRFLFSAVIIGEGTMSRYPSSIDYGRIEIEQNDLG